MLIVSFPILLLCYTYFKSIKIRKKVDKLTYDFTRLKEQMLFPLNRSSAAACDAILGSRILFLATGLHGDQWADSVTRNKNRRNMNKLNK